MDGHIDILILLCTITHPTSYHDLLTLCLTDTVAHKANASQILNRILPRINKLIVPPRTIAYPSCPALDALYNQSYSLDYIIISAATVVSAAELLLLNHERSRK
jgi:hypothetical protein